MELLAEVTALRHRRRLQEGVSENMGVPYFGVLIRRILLFGVLY